MALDDKMDSPDKHKKRHSLEIRRLGRAICRLSSVVVCCQVMFDYKAKAEDELDLKIGDVVVILRKVPFPCCRFLPMLVP